MHQLEADLSGSFVPSTAGGTAVSIHDTVINVRLDKPAKLAGRMLSLVWSRTAMSDLAVLVHNPAPSRTEKTDIASACGTHDVHSAPARRFGVRQDMPVFIDVNRIRVGDTLSVLRHHAHRWTGRPAPLAPSALPTVSAAVNSLLNTWPEHDTRTGMAPLLVSDSAEDPISRKLIRHVRDHQLDRLVGLGIGFTPAGDDFISGVAFLLDWAGPERLGPSDQTVGEKTLETARPDHRTVAQLRGGIDMALRRYEKTTSAGATLLWLVARRSYPAYLHQIGWALASGDADRAIATARSHGHTSGVDALTGMVWAWQSIIAE